MAQAFYGLLRSTLSSYVAPDDLDEVAARFVLHTDSLIRGKLIVKLDKQHRFAESVSKRLGR